MNKFDKLNKIIDSLNEWLCIAAIKLNLSIKEFCNFGKNLVNQQKILNIH